MQLRFLTLFCLLAAATPAAAQSTDQKVVVAPISNLGGEGASKKNRQLADAIVTGIDSVPGFTAVPQKQMLEAIKQAKRPALRTCDGDIECLAKLGALLEAPLVVYGELGGLGDTQVVALKLIDASSRREARSTTAEFGGRDMDREARGAAYRLLAPGLFIGTLLLKVDIDGATIYLDGARIGKSPQPPIRGEVGTHALRVTHPEYRDFVRFVDLRFDDRTKLDVGMKAFPIIEDEMREHSRAGGLIDNGTTRAGTMPWYKKWYTVAGAGVIVFVGSAIVVGMLSDGIDADAEKIVGMTYP